MEDDHQRHTESVLIDSLAYIDFDYDALKEKVDDLIIEEMSRLPARDYLAHLEPIKPLFSDHPILQSGLEIKSQKKPIDGLDLKKYQLISPDHSSPLKDWEVALQNAKSAIEHQHLRSLNLELMGSYGANSWMKYVEQLEAKKKLLSENLESLKNRIRDIHQQRQQSQMTADVQFRQLDREWYMLIEKNRDIEEACKKVEEDIAVLSSSSNSASSSSSSSSL